MSAIRMLVSVLGLSTALSMTACQKQSPGGGVFASEYGPTTLVSTDTMPKSVSMVDTRSGEVFFAMDIPANKQLTWQFHKGEGDDAVYTPDLMRFEVKEIGDKYGKLRNAMTVPGATSRRVDVFFKQVVQYAQPSPEQAALRTDQAAERPDWWTPRGGAMPDDRRHSMYDN
jgi:hypothetical protein